MRYTLKMVLQSHDAEDGWFYRRGNIFEQTFCFLAANLTVDSLFAQEGVRFLIIIDGFTPNNSKNPFLLRVSYSSIVEHSYK